LGTHEGLERVFSGQEEKEDSVRIVIQSTNGGRTHITRVDKVSITPEEILIECVSLSGKRIRFDTQKVSAIEMEQGEQGGQREERRDL
jgi:hypothetical protein